MGETDIAVVGMACRLPGAPDLGAYWDLLAGGRCARVEFSDEQMQRAGATEAALRDPAWVKAGMCLPDVDQFDAAFFGMSPRDAAIMDPQHRVFLEICWEALEHAGHVPAQFAGRIGVFAGCGMNTYLLHNVLRNPQVVCDVGMFLIRHTGNDKDFLATRVSYQFDLRGPSLNVLTACSTSLVAIHQAAQSLIARECDLALAGGVTIQVPQDRGYRHEAGEILSPDGRCRAFDAASQGTVFGSGAGVVVLRRLSEALAAGDQVLAVVAGSAVNNDGARKVGWLAPSVDGYSEVVAEALALAGVTADAVQYVEAHGTGTPVGDPIEIEALTQAFRASTDRTQFCGIGSVKSNLGHLDAAAGIAGFQKVVLSLQAGRVPASLFFERPNPRIDFARTPFRVVQQALDWPEPTGGRVAGVSSLGVGGTNAHVVLKQAPAPALVEPAYPRRYHLLPVAAKSEAALLANARRLADHLKTRSDEDLPAVAATLQTGRAAFAHRGWAVGLGIDDLAAELRDGMASRVQQAPEQPGRVVFLFPGGGAQHPGMGRGLYEHEPVYRAAADQCLQALPPPDAGALRALLFGSRSLPTFGEEMERPSFALPALFLTEYALACTLKSFGVEPVAMLGHSLGEYVAACLAGVFTPAQGMQIALLRGTLFEEVEAGAMLSVALPPDGLPGIDGRTLSLAAANAPDLSVVAGSVEAIAALQGRLEQDGVECQRLRIRVAAHSHLLDPILVRFRDGLAAMELRAAERPFVSNVTGDWIEPQRAADPDYWVEHLRHTVRFHDGVATLLASGDAVFVEVGPGKALTSLSKQHRAAARSACATSLPHAHETMPADRALLECLGRLYQASVTPDWRAFQGGVRRRVALPTYAFQRQRCWIEPAPEAAVALPAPPAPPAPVAPPTVPVPRRRPRAEWLSVPTFAPSDLQAPLPVAARWLVLGRGGELLESFRRQVLELGGSVFAAQPGAAFAPTADGCTFAPRDAASVARMLHAARRGGDPERVLFLLAADGQEPRTTAAALLHLLQALGHRDAAVRLVAVTVAALPAESSPENPEQALVHGFLRVVPREYPNMTVRAIDVQPEDVGDDALAARLLAEAEAAGSEVAIAWRHGRRLLQHLLPQPAPAPARAPWQKRGVYMITGGLGGLGSVVARHLARTASARLVLVTRRGLPPPELWEEWWQRRPHDRVGRAIARISELEAAGAEVLVCAADVADPAAMADVVARTHARFGALHGVFHAAGVLDDGPIQLRTRAQLEAVLAPKLRGAQVLDAATAALPPELMVLFASTSGLCGIPGQSDYAAGNAFLDAFAAWRSEARPGRTLAVDWGAWQQVGMLAESVPAVLEVVPGYAAPPWLGERRTRDGVVELAASWSLATRWQLDEHRLRDGRAVLPGTALFELCLAAARVASGWSEGMELHDVELRAPLTLRGDEERIVYVLVTQVDGGLELSVQSASSEFGERDRTEHARASARAGTGDADLVHIDAWWQTALREAPGPGHPGDFVAFGPRWQSVVRSGHGEGRTVVQLRLPDEFHDDLVVHAMHPALVDAAIGAAVRLLPDLGNVLWVPVACASLQQGAALPAEVVVAATLREVDASARLATLDFEIATPTGVPLVQLRGLQLLGLQGGFAAPPALPARPGAVGPGARARPRRAGGPPPKVQKLLHLGIAPEEGMALLHQALALSVSQVVVSPLDVQATADWLAAAPPARAASAAPAVPAPSPSADAPRDEVEAAVASAFEQVLGVERAGLDQDFFDLGGHSLLAVRLFARLHREYGVDLELATLLSDGTVRALAAVLRRHLGRAEPATAAPEHGPAGCDELAAPGMATASHRGEHVVPIQPRGDRPILFLVHGAGGNVLGFRDLAHYLGADQPVYGLQARGVDGRTQPHQRIEDMAAAYLAELREVQPQGPYYLGGYSGGGCVAYEMALQLRRAGERVAFVGMIDTPTPHMQKRSLASRGVIHLKRMWERGPLYPVRMLKAKLQQRRASQQYRGAAARGEVVPQELRGARLAAAFDTAFFRYEVAPYDGRIWLFRAVGEGRTKFVRDRTLGWDAFPQGGVTVVDCPGDHFSMCAEPHVQELCAQLRQALDEAAAAARRTPEPAELA